MMKQCHPIRRALPPDTALFFWLGNFAVLFGDDAQEGAGSLNA